MKVNDVRNSRHVFSAVCVLIIVFFLVGCVQFPVAREDGQEPRQPSQLPTVSATAQASPQTSSSAEAVPSDGADARGQIQAVTPEIPSTECLSGNEDSCRGTAFEQAPQSAAPPLSGMQQQASEETLDQYLNRIITDLDEKWDAWFLNQGFQQPQLYYELVLRGEDPVVSQCEMEGVPLVVDDFHPNAYYCSLDPYGPISASNNGTMILPATTMQQMWTGNVFRKQSQYPGDFAAATLVAHEYGHHVQDELEIQWRAFYPNYDYIFTGSNKEAIADCFAGNWMASTYYDGTLKPGDYEEGIAALEALGQPQPGGSHPSAEERRAAILLGYNGNSQFGPGDPYACISAYWNPQPTGYASARPFR